MRTGSVFASEGTLEYAYDESITIEELETRLKAEESLAALASYL